VRYKDTFFAESLAFFEQSHPVVLDDVVALVSGYFLLGCIHCDQPLSEQSLLVQQFLLLHPLDVLFRRLGYLRPGFIGAHHPGVVTFNDAVLIVQGEVVVALDPVDVVLQQKFLFHQQ